MTSKGRTTLLILAGLIAVEIGLLSAADRAPVADYEHDYGRADAPAFHKTPVKRLVEALRARGEGAALQDERRWVSPLRLLAISAFVSWAVIELGVAGGLAGAAIFLLLPPAWTYLVRLDSWMDSVCFSMMAVWAMAECRTHPGWRAAGFLLLAGGFVALSVDAKVTGALTLATAVALLWTDLPAAGDRYALIFIAVGFILAYALFQPDVLFDLGRMLEHVEFWRRTNAGLPEQTVSHLIGNLVKAIPVTIWLLSAFAVGTAVREPGVRRALILSSAPIVFLLIYRSVPPDGVRHFYLAFPFLAVLAGCGWIKLKLRWKILTAAVFLAERFGREFRI